jgi:prolyl oligopeptidase
MKPLLVALLLLAAPVAAVEVEDPHLWLEDIEGDKAIEWVKARNARYLPELEAVPGFQAWRARAQEILEDPRRMALPTGALPSGLTETLVFNFWRDAKAVRGQWRVSPRAAWEAGSPDWTVLLDMDALEAAEGRNWQWSSAVCLPPEMNLSLIHI